MTLKLPITPGRYKLRNGTTVRVNSIDQIKASCGTIIQHAFGEEIISGQMRMWEAKTGRRIPQRFPGARTQDIVKRLR